MNEKLSIVVPIYKVEAYLDECINSLVNQTYNNLEIILVDDGSPDNCPAKCDEWAKKDNRIKVIHKKNGGLSDARNVGIREATGKYITFVDSDDYIELDAYNLAMDSILNENADIFIFGRYYLYGDKKEIHQTQNIRMKMDNEEALDKMNTFLYYDVAAWDKVYLRSLFDGIEYPVGKLSEDWYTTYKIIDRANTVIYDSTPLYVYRQRANSITHSGNVKINKDAIQASEDVLEFIEKDHPKIVLNALSKCIYSYIGVYNNLLVYKKDSYLERKELLSKIKNNYSKVIKNKDLNKSRKIQLFLIAKLNIIYNFLIKIFKFLKERKAK